MNQIHEIPLVQPSLPMTVRRLFVGAVATTAVALMGGGIFEAGSARASSLPNTTVKVTQTSALYDQNMAQMPDISLSPTSSAEGNPVLDINDQSPAQVYEALGAALTDTAAYLIDGLPTQAEQPTLPATQTKDGLLHYIFGAQGIGLNFLRIPIGASDFDANGQLYTYDDNPPGGTDPELKHFNIAHDLTYILPELRYIESVNSHLIKYAVPWSAPAWMKSNNRLDNANFSGTLLPQYEATFAKYLTKFVTAYRENGVAVNDISPENEANVPAKYAAMNLSPLGYRSVVPPPANEEKIIQLLHADLNAVKPTIKVGIFGPERSWGDGIKISNYLIKHSNDTINTASNFLLGHTKNRHKSAQGRQKKSNNIAGGSNIAGLSFHCYNGNPDSMRQYINFVPVFVDECATQLKDWRPAEYLINMERDGSSATGGWNLAEDQNQGPYFGTDSGCRGCTGLAQINTTNHEVYLSTDLYDYGQIAHFVKPGARVVASTTAVTYNPLGELGQQFQGSVNDVVIRNPGPDGEDVMIADNPNTSPVTFSTNVDGTKTGFTATLPGQTMATYRWHPSSPAVYETIGKRTKMTIPRRAK